MTTARLVIKSGQSDAHYWADLWRFRELFYVLAWRDVAVRYKQTVVGIAWAFFQPVLTTAITVFVFNILAKLPAPGGVPYPLFVLAAMLPWQFFSTALSGSSQSLVANTGLISKVYFPRMIVPASAVATALVDFLVTSCLLVAVMIWYRYWPGWHLLLLPGFVAFAILAALGPGLLLTALTVRYRDFKVIVPFILQFGLYLSPVGYSANLVQVKFPHLYPLYFLNPMAGVIEGFRWCLLGGAERLEPVNFLVSLSVALILLGFGIRYFRRMERTFADVI
jgi:lipopolysaccharide transport system permease protein